MAYAADLITVLKSLFGKVTQPSSSEAPKATRRALTEVYQTHKTSDTRRGIYRRIREDFQQKQQILGRDEEVFRRLLRQSLGSNPASPPDPTSTKGVASSSPSPGVAASSRATGMATSSPVIGVAPPPPRSTVKPPTNVEDRALEPQSGSANVWSRLVGCLTHPC